MKKSCFVKLATSSIEIHPTRPRYRIWCHVAGISSLTTAREKWNLGVVSNCLNRLRIYRKYITSLRRNKRSSFQLWTSICCTWRRQ